MPQPINKLVKDPWVTLDKNALSDNPAMAILICQIFATWASIERHLDGLLVRMIGAQVAPAHAIFSVLQAQHLQTRALEAAARASLDAVGLEAFLACKKVIDGVQKTRNRLAHWAWGKCKERPDLLILADPQMLKERDARSAAFFQSLQPQTDVDLNQAWEAIQFNDDYLYAYSVDDLSRDLRDLEEADDLCTALGIFLDPSIGLVGHPGYGEPLTTAEIRRGTLERMQAKRLFAQALSQIRAKPEK